MATLGNSRRRRRAPPPAAGRLRVGRLAPSMSRLQVGLLALLLALAWHSPAVLVVALGAEPVLGGIAAAEPAASSTFTTASLPPTAAATSTPFLNTTAPPSLSGATTMPSSTPATEFSSTDSSATAATSATSATTTTTTSAATTTITTADGQGPSHQAASDVQQPNLAGNLQFSLIIIEGQPQSLVSLIFRVAGYQNSDLNHWAVTANFSRRTDTLRAPVLMLASNSTGTSSVLCPQMPASAANAIVVASELLACSTLQLSELAFRAGASALLLVPAVGSAVGSSQFIVQPTLRPDEAGTTTPLPVLAISGQSATTLRSIIATVHSASLGAAEVVLNVQPQGAASSSDKDSDATLQLIIAIACAGGGALVLIIIALAIRHRARAWDHEARRLMREEAQADSEAQKAAAVQRAAMRIIVASMPVHVYHGKPRDKTPPSPSKKSISSLASKTIEFGPLTLEEASRLAKQEQGGPADRERKGEQVSQTAVVDSSARWSSDSQSDNAMPEDIAIDFRRKYCSKTDSTEEDSVLQDETDSHGHHSHSSGHLSCAVCLADYEDGDVIMTLPCKHQFHRPCVQEWLMQRQTCPLCKFHLILDRYLVAGSEQFESPEVQTMVTQAALAILRRLAESQQPPPKPPRRPVQDPLRVLADKGSPAKDGHPAMPQPRGAAVDTAPDSASLGTDTGTGASEEQAQGAGVASLQPQGGGQTAPYYAHLLRRPELLRAPVSAGPSASHPAEGTGTGNGQAELVLANGDRIEREELRRLVASVPSVMPKWQANAAGPLSLLAAQEYFRHQAVGYGQQQNAHAGHPADASSSNTTLTSHQRGVVGRRLSVDSYAAADDDDNERARQLFQAHRRRRERPPKSSTTNWQELRARVLADDQSLSNSYAENEDGSDGSCGQEYDNCGDGEDDVEDGEEADGHSDQHRRRLHGLESKAATRTTADAQPVVGNGKRQGQTDKGSPSKACVVVRLAPERQASAKKTKRLKRSLKRGSGRDAPADVDVNVDATLDHELALALDWDTSGDRSELTWQPGFQPSLRQRLEGDGDSVTTL